MELSKLIEDMKRLSVKGSTSVGVSGVSYDSRRVSPGDVFVALSGEHYDGRAFIDDAVAKGAVAVVLEGDCPDCGVTTVTVEDSRTALAIMSANFYGRPADRLKMIGVTGTNGKTTTTHIIKLVIEQAGGLAGMIGTISYTIGDRVYPAPHTTPEALEFQALLSEMTRAGMTHAVAEVSSHALSQKRVDATYFDVAVFTNLTREHLDYHKDMDAYYEAKKRLFTDLLKTDGTAVVNIDDTHGMSLHKELKAAGVTVVTYGLGEEADLRATELELSFDGTRFVLVRDGKKLAVSTGLVGMPNIYNVLSAWAACEAAGVSEVMILKGINAARTVRGRFEKVDMGQGFLCIVDYAHTPDAIENLIVTARHLAREEGGRVITVFGCGGDRDRGKRPEMGRIASELSDITIVTSDNPRGEDPEGIIKDIKEGIKTGECHIYIDRRDAINRSIAMARPGDIVLIAGKGHEDYQEIKGKRYPFSDRREAEEAISIRMGEARGGD